MLSDDAQHNLIPTGFGWTVVVLLVYEISLLTLALCLVSHVTKKWKCIVAWQLVFDIRHKQVILILSALVMQGCGGVRAQAGRYRQRQSVPQRGLQAGEHKPPEQVCSTVSITCSSAVNRGCHWNTSELPLFVYICFCRTLIPLFLIDLAVYFIRV